MWREAAHTWMLPRNLTLAFPSLKVFPCTPVSAPVYLIPANETPANRVTSCGDHSCLPSAPPSLARTVCRGLAPPPKSLSTFSSSSLTPLANLDRGHLTTTNTINSYFLHLQPHLDFHPPSTLLPEPSFNETQTWSYHALKHLHWLPLTSGPSPNFSVAFKCLVQIHLPYSSVSHQLFKSFSHSNVHIYGQYISSRLISYCFPKL